MTTVMDKTRKEMARTFGVCALLNEDGSIEKIEILGAPWPADGWPAITLLSTVFAPTERAARKMGIDWLRINRPTWVRYLSSKPNNVSMKNLQGHAQPPKAWNRGTIKRPTAVPK